MKRNESEKMEAGFGTQLQVTLNFELYQLRREGAHLHPGKNAVPRPMKLFAGGFS